MDVNVNMTVASPQFQPVTQMHAPDPIVSEREAIERALIWSTQALERLQHKRKRGESNEDDSEDVSDDGALEEPLIKCIRFNLLVLAKRAPLDKIGPPPAELVPESTRGMVRLTVSVPCSRRIACILCWTTVLSPRY
ncbi:hypothetical protein F5141DRAFT_1080502 [Pisolithus sp. B1]|nr:hypothetical protein F5141DRAFT_1080502 [Pisolithus sp. B1]